MNREHAVFLLTGVLGLALLWYMHNTLPNHATARIGAA